MADNTVSQLAPIVNENSTIHIDFLNEQTPVVSSLDVARHFQRRHSHILRDIGRLCSILPKSFHQPNFGRVEIPDVKGEKRPAYLLTRDAFSLLVMGMTGKAAIQWKLRYIEAFNALEAAALGRQAELARQEGYGRGVSEARRAIAEAHTAMTQARESGRKEGAEAMLALPPKRRETLKKALHYAKMGLSCREIAKLIDGNQRQIGHLLSLARKNGLLAAAAGESSSRADGDSIAAAAKQEQGSLLAPAAISAGVAI